MSNCSRRSILSALGLSLPFGAGARALASPEPGGSAPEIWFRPFEEAVRAAFAETSGEPGIGLERTGLCRRLEVGESEEVRAGVQGCHNDRAFAGFPAGHLRIVRTGSGPGPARHGVRLFVATVDVMFTGGLAADIPSRPLDFGSLPPAPVLKAERTGGGNATGRSPRRRGPLAYDGRAAGGRTNDAGR